MILFLLQAAIVGILFLFFRHGVKRQVIKSPKHQEKLRLSSQNLLAVTALPQKKSTLYSSRTTN
jgi:hypothetical protein